MLTIIIPAYKPFFLRETLESLTKQTVKDFQVYVGNDGSTDEIEEIVERFSPILNLKYHKFKNNLGKISLVKSWERCIDNAPENNWYWLLSDDDYIENNCVELFYAKKNKNPQFNVFRFNLKIVNEKSEIIKTIPKQKEIELAKEFCIRMLEGKTMNTISDFIFSKEAYLKHKFIGFPLAWHSDYATWITMSENMGIYTIPESFVYWRNSGKNISSLQSKSVLKKKNKADIMFYKWSYDFLLSNTSYEKISNLTFNWLVSRLKTGANPSFLQTINILFTVKGISTYKIFITVLQQRKFNRFFLSWIRLSLRKIQNG